MGMVGLPGTWVIVAAAAIQAWAAPHASAPEISWMIVGVLVSLAALAEVLEGVASALGVSRVGASRRATLYAVLGSIVGGVAGVVIGMPVPVVGPLVAAVLFGGAGAAVGAAWAEWNRGETPSRALRVGNAAFWGRILGSVAKAAIATLMAVLTMAALIF